MTNVEKFFQVLDDTAEIIKDDLKLSFLEALAETGDNLFQQEVLQTIAPVHKNKLVGHYESLNVEQLKNEEVRKAFQLAVLKGMREATQPHHEITPDGVALFISYLINKVTAEQKTFSILDPAVGVGNLLTAILNQTDKASVSYGIDADDLLLRLAFISANLQKHETEFSHQDSLKPLMVRAVDLVVCDLPVGYYPDEVTAANYKLKATSGRSFAHHLMIEQSIKHTKEGGFLFFIIPNGLFEGDEATTLKQFLNEHVVIQGLLQLPLTMFKKEQHAKSIFMLQKKGKGVVAPKQTLLAELPSFSNQRALQEMMQKIDAWFRNEFK